LRYGAGSNLELQLVGSLWIRSSVRSGGVTTHEAGASDTRVALQWAPRLAAPEWSLAVLGAVSFDTGSAAFTDGDRVYSAGGVLARDLGDGRSAAAYVNLDRGGGTSIWTSSLAYGLAVSEAIGVSSKSVTPPAMDRRPALPALFLLRPGRSCRRAYSRIKLRAR